METFKYQLLSFLEPTESHFKFKWDFKPPTWGKETSSKDPLSYSSTNQIKLVCNNLLMSGKQGSLMMLTLLFQEDKVTEFVSDMKGPYVTIKLPVSYFASIHTALREAFADEKHSLVLNVMLDYNFKKVELDFVAK